MHKHREHHFDNSQTGGWSLSSVFMPLWQVFKIIMKKFVPYSGPHFGGASYTQVRLILE